MRQPRPDSLFARALPCDQCDGEKYCYYAWNIHSQELGVCIGNDQLEIITSNLEQDRYDILRCGICGKEYKVWNTADQHDRLLSHVCANIKVALDLIDSEAFYLAEDQTWCYLSRALCQTFTPKQESDIATGFRYLFGGVWVVESRDGSTEIYGDTVKRILEDGRIKSTIGSVWG